MTIRTSVAFDPATTARWERLTRRWGVSKSEALRRALEVAETPLPASTEELSHAAAVPPKKERIAEMSAADALAWLHTNSLVTAAEGHLWREQLRQTREDFASRP